MTPTAEERFIKLLDAADQATLTISEAHGTGGFAGDPSSYPRLTAIKIERQATIEFRSGLALLRDPVFDYGTEMLLRSVLEATGQLWRIYGNTRSSVVKSMPFAQNAS